MKLEIDNMQINIKDLKKSGKRDIFTITMDGWWGDMDELCHRTEDFGGKAKGKREFLDTYLALEKYRHNYVDDKKDLEKSDLFTDKEKEILEDVLPVDIGMMFPSLDSIEIAYYDKDGYEHEVEIAK